MYARRYRTLEEVETALDLMYPRTTRCTHVHFTTKHWRLGQAVPYESMVQPQRIDALGAGTTTAAHTTQAGRTAKPTLN